MHGKSGVQTLLVFCFQSLTMKSYRSISGIVVVRTEDGNKWRSDSLTSLVCRLCTIHKCNMAEENVNHVMLTLAMCSGAASLHNAVWHPMVSAQNTTPIVDKILEDTDMAPEEVATSIQGCAPPMLAFTCRCAYCLWDCMK